jgi:putative spermidine/putrescine transport system permease protein
MAFGALVGLILLFLVAPIIVVVATAFGTSPYPVFPPSGLTLRWFEKVLTTRDVLEAARLSATLAACTAVLSTTIGTLSALALVRFRIRAHSLVSSLLLSPIIFPAIVLGLALLVFYHRVGLAATFSGLVAAHVLLTAPFVLRLVMASLAEFDSTIEEAARNLGAGVLRTFMRVTLPLIRPGVIAGALFAFILSFDELVVTLLPAGPGRETQPIRIFTYVEYSSDPSISAISTMLIVLWFVVGVPVYLRYLTVKH